VKANLRERPCCGRERDEAWIDDGKMEWDLIPEQIEAMLTTSAVALTPPASPSRFESRISASGWEGSDGKFA
jgi:hypothetical protein